MSAWKEAATAIADSYAHGHDDFGAGLNAGCALCIAEYDAVVNALQAARADEEPSP